MSLIEKALIKKESESQRKKTEPAENSRQGHFNHLKSEAEIFSSIDSKSKQWTKILMISVGIFLILGISAFIINYFKKSLTIDKMVLSVSDHSSKQWVNQNQNKNLTGPNHNKKTITTYIKKKIKKKQELSPHTRAKT